MVIITRVDFKLGYLRGRVYIEQAIMSILVALVMVNLMDKGFANGKTELIIKEVM
jgi:hypothetical protein